MFLEFAEKFERDKLSEYNIDGWIDEYEDEYDDDIYRMIVIG